MVDTVAVQVVVVVVQVVDQIVVSLHLMNNLPLLV